MMALRGLVLLLGVLVLPAMAGASGVACGAPPELLEANGPLPGLVRAVGSGTLRILAVGSASVIGPGTSGPAAAWPARLEAILAERRPGLKLEVTVRGGRGATATDTARAIEEELAKGPLDLVLWQTGTVEAVRNLEVDEMVEALNGGLAKVQARGAEAVLIDLQFSRFLRANANVDAYRDAIRIAAAANHVPLLRRYDLMRFWAETDRVDLERASPRDRVVVADRLNGCLAEALAALLRDGAQQARARAAAKP